MKGIFRIGIAIVAGIALIGGAYFLQPSAIADSDIPNDASSLIAAKMLREYQNVEDTDDDGKPDWQESLVGTDPTTANLRPTTTTSFEAKTETDRFMVDFFASYLEKRGRGPLDTKDVIDFATASAHKVQGLNSDVVFTQKDIRIVSDTAESFSQYGNTAGEILLRNSTSNKATENEAVILKKAVETDNKAELARLRPIREGYAGMIRELQKVAVPQSLAKNHVDLLTSLQAIHDDIKAMEKVFEDPIITFVRVKRYQDDATGLLRALEGIRAGLQGQSVQFSKSEPGAFLYSF